MLLFVYIYSSNLVCLLTGSKIIESFSGGAFFFPAPCTSSNYFFLPLRIMSFESTAIIPPWHITLMNAFQPPLLCFSASHYRSVELISFLAAGAITRLLSLIYNFYSIPAVSCCFISVFFFYYFGTKTSLFCGFCFMSH